MCPFLHLSADLFAHCFTHRITLQSPDAFSNNEITDKFTNEITGNSFSNGASNFFSDNTLRPPKKTLAKNWKNRCHQRHRTPPSAIKHVSGSQK